MKKPIKILLTILVLILLSIFSYSAYQLYDIYHGYKVAENYNTENVNKYVTETTSSPQQSSDQSSSAQSSNGSSSAAIAEKSPITVDFNQLLATNPDVVGWLYCPDTVINYPICQSTDNAKYLHTLMDGSYNANGTIFLDYRNASNFSDKNTLIYGHHMNDGSMFASLVNYSKPEYMQAHPVMYLNTPTQNYKIEIFSGFITASDSSSYTMAFKDNDTFESFAAKIKAFSEVQTNVSVRGTDNIVMFSTCTYEYTDARYVVFGKLTPIN